MAFEYSIERSSPIWWQFRDMFSIYPSHIINNDVARLLNGRVPWKVSRKCLQCWWERDDGMYTKLIEILLKSWQRQKKRKKKNQEEEASTQWGEANRSKTTWTKPDLLCWWLTTNWWLLQNHTLNAFSFIFSVFSLTFLTQFHWMIIIKPFIIQISFKFKISS